METTKSFAIQARQYLYRDPQLQHYLETIDVCLDQLEQCPIAC